MPEALPSLLPENYAAHSPKCAFLELCSLKRLGVTVREELVGILPKAIQYVKGKKSMTPILESAAATAAKGNTVNGARIVRRTLAAMVRGDFSSGNVSQAVVVNLRDALCALEAELEHSEAVPVAETETPTRGDQSNKDLRKAFCSLIGTRKDPRCRVQLHQCLTDTGFSTETWLSPHVQKAVKESVDNRPDMVYYAKLLADSPPDAPIESINSEGVRLGIWSLLCKMGAGCSCTAYGMRVLRCL